MKSLSGIFILYCLFINTVSYTQTQLLSSETRAYIYHIVKQSPVLESTIGYAFEYNGPIIKLKNGKINYDSIEFVIINQPDLLIIRENELSKASKGLLAEVANKTAIWILNKSLNAIRYKQVDYDNEFIDEYLATFQDKLDFQLTRSKSFELLFQVNSSPIFNPGLSLYDRDLLLLNLGYVKAEDRKTILDAQNEAVVSSVEKRAKRIFESLGGQYQKYENILLAAGDGSYTTGLLEEKERDEEGIWNNGLPKAVGLFPYQLEIRDDQVYSSRIALANLESLGENLQTNLHFDVWGYNTNKQTTVVIERQGKTYRLYGSSKTKFLSPDSSFSSGVTFQKIINDLNDASFQRIQKRLYGQGGLVTQENKIIQQIKEIEIKIQELYVTQERTSNRSSKKQASIEPEGVIELKDKMGELKDELSSLRDDIEPLLEEYNSTKTLIDYYQKNIGIRNVPFQERDGIYMYEDSCFFNPKTQEFITPPSLRKELLNIRLIAIPDDPEGISADEVMLHVSKTDFNSLASPDLQLVLKDGFSSDKIELKNSFSFSGEDSLRLKRFFRSYQEHVPIIFDLYGQGIGVWQNGKITKDQSPKELATYPGNSEEEKISSKESFPFSSLRRTQLTLKKSHQLIIKIESFTDPVRSGYTSKNNKLNEILKAGKITSNDILSTHRSVSVLEEFSEAFLALAQKEMKKELFEEFKKRYLEAQNESVIFIANLPIPLKSF
jgi:hypothetical protein